MVVYAVREERNAGNGMGRRVRRVDGRGVSGAGDSEFGPEAEADPGSGVDGVFASVRRGEDSVSVSVPDGHEGDDDGGGGGDRLTRL